METKEESQRPVISSWTRRYLQSPCAELWVEPHRKERNLRKQEMETEGIRDEGQGAAERFLTILFPKPLYVVSSLYQALPLEFEANFRHFGVFCLGALQ